MTPEHYVDSSISVENRNLGLKLATSPSLRRGMLGRNILMSKSEKKAPRLVGRQFAAPLSQHEIDQVAGGEDVENGIGGGTSATCTHGNDGD